MEDNNVAILVEAKNEYNKQIINILRPYILEGIKSIYNEAKTTCRDNNDTGSVLIIFQNMLCEIPKWSTDKKDKECQRIIESSKCDYLQDLISAIFICQTKILGVVHDEKTKEKIKTKIPKDVNFVHHCYVESARIFWKNPFLFSENVSQFDYQRHMRETESIISEAIEETIRKRLPVRGLLKNNLDGYESEGENGDEDIQVSLTPSNLRKLKKLVNKEIDNNKDITREELISLINNSFPNDKEQEQFMETTSFTTDTNTNTNNNNEETPVETNSNSMDVVDSDNDDMDLDIDFEECDIDNGNLESFPRLDSEQQDTSSNNKEEDTTNNMDVDAEPENNKELLQIKDKEEESSETVDELKPEDLHLDIVLDENVSSKSQEETNEDTENINKDTENKENISEEKKENVSEEIEENKENVGQTIEFIDETFKNKEENKEELKEISLVPQGKEQNNEPKEIVDINTVNDVTDLNVNELPIENINNDNENDDDGNSESLSDLIKKERLDSVSSMGSMNSENEDLISNIDNADLELNELTDFEDEIENVDLDDLSEDKQNLNDNSFSFF